MAAVVPRPFLAPPEDPFQPEFSAWADVGAEAGASYLLYYDELTGLPNHRWWARHLAAEVERGGRLAVLWVGLDSVEEEFGPRQADHVLACLATRLREVVGARGTAARLGGREFAVLLPGLDRERAGRVAGDLLARLRTGRVRLLDSALEVAVTASLGLACSPEDVTDLGEVAARAERAGRQARREGRNRLVVAGASEAPVRPRRIPCPRLVGRQPLLAQLREALPGRPVLVLRGPAGSGRTRLLAERLGDHLVLSAAARAARADAPFGCLAEALAAAPRSLLAGLSPSEVRRVASVLPFLGTPEKEAGDPAPLLVRMLTGLAREQAVLLRLDDADWCDRGTLRALELLLREERAPAVLLVLGNDEPAHPEALEEFLQAARAGGLLQELEVPPLTPAQVEEMVAEVLPGPPPALDLVELVARRSGGSPLLVQECLQLLLEAERLVDKDGHLSVRPLAGEEAEPLLQARSAALPAPVRDLLARAAALGAEFGLPELAGLVRGDEGRLRGDLEEAVRANVLDRGEGPDRYRFTSGGMQDALYRTLPSEARVQLHDVLAQRAQGAELAWHLRRAGRGEEARRLTEELETPFLAEVTEEGEGLTSQDLPSAGYLAHQVRRLLQALRMYGPDHPEVREVQEIVLGLVGELLQRAPHVELSEAGGVVRANGLPLGTYAPTLAVLEPGGLHSLTFTRGLGMGELQAFCRAVARKPNGTLARLLHDSGVVHLVPDEDLYVPAQDRRILVQELQDLGATLGSRELGPEDAERMRNLRQELAAWYAELSRYVNLEFLDALSQDWDVLCCDLGSADRVKVAAASRAFLSNGELGRYRLVQFLARSADERARKVAAELLQRTGEEAVGDLVEAVHRSSVDEERCRLLQALAGFPDVDSHLLAFASHPVRAVRREALRALEGRPVRGLEAELARLLERGHRAELRVDAADFAGRCRLAGLGPHLCRIVRRRSVFVPEDARAVQAAACHALGVLGLSEAVPFLLRAVERPWPLWWTKSEEVRAAAVLALADLPAPQGLGPRVRRAVAAASLSRSQLLSSAAKLALQRLQRRAAP